jgi:hypothetical protein
MTRETAFVFLVPAKTDMCATEGTDPEPPGKNTGVTARREAFFHPCNKPPPYFKTFLGRCRVKVLPAPGVLSNVISPP